MIMFLLCRKIKFYYIFIKFFIQNNSLNWYLKTHVIKKLSFEEKIIIQGVHDIQDWCPFFK